MPAFKVGSVSVRVPTPASMGPMISTTVTLADLVSSRSFRRRVGEMMV